MDFLQIFVLLLEVYNEFKDYEKNPYLKYLKLWNLRPKPDLAITFWAVFLMISFEDFILIFYIYVPSKKIESTMKYKNPI